jgi:hypothetical protein
MRILLATEGPVDEVVAECLIRQAVGDPEIERKRFPARGFPVVFRLMDAVVRAAHFGHYDWLVVHFDLDDSLPPEFRKISESPRWQEIQTRIHETLTDLPLAGRPQELQVFLMAPCQATEAWLAWGIENADGERWEKQDRRALKRRLFGNPPHGLVDKSLRIVRDLVHQMEVHRKWPRSLRDFIDEMGRLHPSSHIADHDEAS